MSGLSDNTKISLSVVASGLIPSFAAPGVVYCVEKVAPSQMTWLKKIFAKHLIEPNFAVFEKLSKGVEKAHEKHREQRREERLKRGEIIKDETPPTKQERAYDISDSLVKGAVALGWDFVGTYVVQKLLNKVLKANVKAFNTSVFDLSVYLGCIATFPTVFAGFFEGINHSSSRIVQKITGMDKKSADNLALPFTYTTLPGIASTALTLLYAHAVKGRG